MSLTIKATLRLLCIAFVCGLMVRADAAMVFTSAERIIAGSGTQLVDKTETDDAMSGFTDDLLNTGYVRDGDVGIVGSVSSSASQTSTLTGGQIRGLGRGSGFGSGHVAGESSFGIGMSSMLVEFTVDEPMQFTLAGELRLAPHGDGLTLNDSKAYVRLIGPDGEVALEAMMDDTNVPDNLGRIDFSGSERKSGEFPAGNYILEAMAEGHGSNGLTRCVDFDFTLSASSAASVVPPTPVVPEPSSMVLASLALLATMGLRRRR